MSVNVDIEYCGTCGYANKFDELSKYLIEKHPQLEIKGHEGGRATFEIKVNGILIHSKLNTLAWPDHDDLSNVVQDAYDGKEIRPVKAQPITNCIIM